MRSNIMIREVGPREALQAHAVPLPTDKKVKLISGLLESGIKQLNAVSLVSPRAMPHMADAEAVLEALGPVDGVIISGLAPNERALDRAIRLRESSLLDQVFLLHAATSSVLSANGLPPSLDENLDRIRGLATDAKGAGLRTGVFISAAFGCSMEGEVRPATVLGMVEILRDLETVDEIIISDSTGQADPLQVSQLLKEVADIVGEHPVAVHLHDSRGTAVANAIAVIESPIRHLTLDASFGGLGGDIPFIPEAAGNVATEDLVAVLEAMGVATGIEASKVAAVSREYKEWTGLPLRSNISLVPPVSWKMKKRFAQA